MGDVLDVPGGPPGGEDHEIGPLGVVVRRYDLDVVGLDVAENSLDLVEIKQAFDGGGGEGMVQRWKS